MNKIQITSAGYISTDFTRSDLAESSFYNSENKIKTYEKYQGGEKDNITLISRRRGYFTLEIKE